MKKCEVFCTPAVWAKFMPVSQITFGWSSHASICKPLNVYSGHPQEGPGPLCVWLAAGLASHSLRHEASGSMDTPSWTYTQNFRRPAAKRTPNDAEAATVKPLTGKGPQGSHSPAPLLWWDKTEDRMGGRQDLLEVRQAVVSSLPKRRPCFSLLGISRGPRAGSSTVPPHVFSFPRKPHDCQGSRQSLSNQITRRCLI